MGCNCNQSSSSPCGSGCSKWRAMDVVTPLNDIRNGDENFCFTEITNQICENLKNDEGINPSVTNSNTDCDDLSSLNDLATGSLHNALITLNMCDVEAYKCWLDSLLSWNWNVDKAIICAICGMWEKIHCLDNKTRNSVRVVELWNGSENIFDLPSIPVNGNLSDFDYLDLHLRFGTERVVGRVALEGNIANFATLTLMDKTGANTSYNIAAGAIIAKEMGIQYPNVNTVKIDHFIWSISSKSDPILDVVLPGVFIAFSSTPNTESYNNTQDTPDDIPHTIVKIEGIISRDTGSCIDGSGSSSGDTTRNIYNLLVDSPDKTIQVEQDNESLSENNINLDLEVNISSDSNNIITKGSDEGLYASITPNVETSKPFTIVSNLGYHDAHGIYSETLATTDNRIAVNQQSLESLLKDDEVVIAHILEPAAFPTKDLTVTGTFTYGEITGPSTPIDLAIPVAVKISTAGLISIPEISPILPAHTYTLNLSDGTTYAYPSLSSTLIQSDMTVISRADFILNGFSWNIQWED